MVLETSETQWVKLLLVSSILLDVDFSLRLVKAKSMLGGLKLDV